MKASELQVADIILTSRSFKSSPVSAVIKVGTLSSYSHTILYIGGGMVIEAISEGVTKRSVSDALAGCDLKTAYRHSQMTDTKAQQIVQFAEDKIGGDYAVPGVLSGSGVAVVGYAPIAIPLMAGRTLTNAILQKTGKKRSYFCSELVADAYLSAGLPLGIYGRTPSLMNPGDIGEYSDRNPQKLVKLGEVD